MMADMNDSATQSAQSSGQQQQQTSIQAGDPNARIALTLRLLMQGKEVGSIIGKKGDNIKRFREVSGAKINVSDSSCLDRIVTLSGSLDEVYNAFSMICSKFEEQMMQTNTPSVATDASGQHLNIASTASDSTLGGENKVTGVCANLTDPLFGLPSASLLNSALKDAGNNESDLLTINNNNTTTINNNDLEIPNKNGVTASSNPTTISGSNKLSGQHHPSITTRLIVPASQCGSLIGRGGAKIKEIRDVTGATIQVAPDVLPNSTERVVTINGNVESLKSCAYQIFKIMVESPAKGYVVQYRPKPAINPMLLAAATAGQAAAAYNLPGQFALSTHPDVNRLFVANNSLAAAAFNQTTLRAAAAVAASAQQQQQIGSHEMAIPNGLIGCVIGKGGSKINEIRQLSGAIIKISNSEEGTKSRTVTISGSQEAISLAQYLINASCNGHQTFVPNKSARKFAPY